MTRQRRLDTAAGRLPLGGGWEFAGAAATFTSVYLAAGALMPLLVVYKERWALPATLLTLAFAVFAVGFLVAVLILGSLSDCVGRRPVLIGALIVQLASNVMFLVAPEIACDRRAVVQGFATGAATAAFTAALVELRHRAERRWARRSAALA